MAKDNRVKKTEKRGDEDGVGEERDVSRELLGSADLLHSFSSAPSFPLLHHPRLCSLLVLNAHSSEDGQNKIMVCSLERRSESFPPLILDS